MLVVQADLVGSLHLLQQVLNPLLRADVHAGVGVRHGRDEAVDTDLHDVSSFAQAHRLPRLLLHAQTVLLGVAKLARRWHHH
jgi:hypothetical protein